MMYYKYVISPTVNPQEGALQMSGFQLFWRTKSTPCAVVTHINHPRVSHRRRRVVPPLGEAEWWRRPLHVVSGNTEEAGTVMPASSDRDCSNTGACPTTRLRPVAALFPIQWAVLVAERVAPLMAALFVKAWSSTICCTSR